MPPIRRTLKNVVKNYSEAQVKVREATSNDPWGPSSTLMSEVSDLTYNVVAFTEIMQMVWKRLNDDGKNWRHVYKALTLLEYIIKTGSEKVAQQCKENFHAIKTLTSFQHTDVDNKDQGMNVREKAKHLVTLLSDDERLKNERAKAIKAKERFAQNSAGIGSAGPGPTPTGKVRLGRSSPETHSPPVGGTPDTFGNGTGYNDSSPSSGDLTTEMENARPSSPGEEELQLQLALALSKEEHDEEVKKLQSDEMKLQMALEQSKQSTDPKQPTESLLDMSITSTAAAAPTAAGANTDPWGMPLSGPEPPPKDPWGGPLPAPPPVSKPWGGAPPASRTTPTPGAAAVAPASVPAAPVDPWGMPVASSAKATPPVTVTDQPIDPWSSGAKAGGDGAFGGVQLDAFGAPVAATSGGTGPTSTLDNEFDLLSARSSETSPAKAKAAVNEFDLLGGGGSSGDAWNMGGMQENLPDPSRTKSPEGFLGANANLVNLDQLVADVPSKGNNPFAAPASGSNNPFQQNGSGGRVAMTQMGAPSGFSQPPAQSTLLPTPLMPMNPMGGAQPLGQPHNTSYNPFL
ncbi:hypothetical protein ACOMHN_007172 [Nucella lapillus]